MSVCGVVGVRIGLSDLTVKGILPIPSYELTNSLPCFGPETSTSCPVFASIFIEACIGFHKAVRGFWLQGCRASDVGW